MNNQEITWLLQEKYDGQETPSFFEDVQRINNGEPLAYVIGWSPFCNTKIFLDSHPLIPRTETEYWVNTIIKKIKDSPISSPKILDLCAGSGCIGIAVLHSISDAQVDFVEKNITHHATIQKNITANDINSDRANILGGDLFEQVTDTYDFILTNPPYVDQKKNDVDQNVLEHEPHDALYGGIHGMELIEKIIHEAPRFLKPNGILIIEHDPDQVSEIKHLAPQAVTDNDQYGIPRITQIAYGT